jgi:hypothetical protein
VAGTRRVAGLRYESIVPLVADHDTGTSFVLPSLKTPEAVNAVSG